MKSAVGRRVATATTLVFAMVVTLLVSIELPAAAVGLDQGLVVSDDPVDYTPHVLDGQVNAITTVGDLVVIGGDFSQVRRAGTSNIETRNYIFAFDRHTGEISSTFVPDLDGEVWTVDAAEDGTSVFVGGSFANVNGGANFGLAKLDVATGAQVAGFDATTAGKVRDLVVHDGKVYLGGDIWSVNGITRTRMAVVDAVTGAVDPSFTVATTEPRVSVDWVAKLDVSPDGSKMVIVGNFLEVDGLPREQIAMIDLTGPTAQVSDWSTDRYADACAAVFWTYMRDVDFSPDGEYFGIVTTGAAFPGTLCDTAARWESDAAGSGQLETWADWTGGDTLTAVAISDVAFYIGGHQRWLNNHLGTDNAQPGAVRREGIAALDPINGVPYSWDPGKDRGVAVFDLHLSDLGLYVGSDTDFTANEYHPKLAQFPLAGGTPVPVPTPTVLPSNLYSGEGTTLTTRTFDGATFGADEVVAGNVLDYGSVVGIFHQAGTLYYMEAGSGDLHSRTFDGVTMGAQLTEPSWIDWDNATAAGWLDGRLYFTESGSDELRYRYFSLESGIVGSQEFTVSGNGDGLDWTDTRGMAFADGRLYYATGGGDLYRVDLDGVAPVAGTQTLVSGPAAGDGRDWSGADLFFYEQDAAPTVTITSPGDGDALAGTVVVTADASDDNAVTEVEFFADGGSLGVDDDGSDGWSVTWDTTAGSDGTVALSATASDGTGQTASDQIDVTVDNNPPSVTLTAPLDGATVSGVVPLTADATDAVGVVQVEFFVDGSSVGVDADGSDGWSATWDSTGGPDGAVTVAATASDDSGQTDTDSVGVTVANAAGGVVVFVVGNPAALSSGDTEVRDRLETLGFTVSLVDDTGVTAGASAGASFVIVSSTVSSAVGDTFRDVAEPVWNAKPYLFDDFDMAGPTAGVDYGSVSGSTVTIEDPSSPLAAGLSGDVVVTAANNPMSWSVPGGTGEVVATVAGKPTIVLYQPGATLADGSTAAGCRLSVSIFQQAPQYFTADGWALFDAAALYAGGGCGDVAPTVQLTSPLDGATVSGTTNVAATASDDGTVTQVEFLAGGASIGVDADGSDGWGLAWDTTTVNDGSVVVEAVATDDQGQSGSDSVEVTVDNLGLSGAKVVVVSVDGLRPDQVLLLGATELPNFFRFIDEGSSTDNARTMFDSTRTLPNHTSMLTALPVLGPDGHQVTFNEDDGLTVHDAAGTYVASMFDVAHDHGLTTLLYAGKAKFDFLDRSWDAVNGAVDVTGADDGRDKIDHYQTDDGASITTSFTTLAAATPVDLGVLHYADPDTAGHDFGWESAEYLDSLRDVDAYLGQLLAFVEADPGYAGNTAVLLTTDHGGTGVAHGDETLAVNYTIPLYAWGSGVAAGGELYAMNPATRLDPGIGRPDHDAVPQPIRNADVGNLALDMLGLDPIPGSIINVAQDLDVATLPADAPPTVSITGPADGATVSGSLVITATASDDVGVSQVEFFADGASLGTDTDGSDGWSVIWDTTTGGDGAVSVTATATDTSAQTATDSIAVTVDNGLPPLVVFVVGNPSNLSAGDEAIQERLETLGFTVAVVDDNDAVSADANGAAFVLVASSVNSSVVGDTFYGVDEPVWMAKPWALDDMGMTGTASGDFGSTPSSVATIVDAAHPLAAGYSGDVTMTTNNARMSWGIPAAAADVVAEVDGLATTFVYQAGDTLADATPAAGCRLTFSLFQSAPANFTADGTALFDATIAYIADGCG